MKKIANFSLLLLVLLLSSASCSQEQKQETGVVFSEFAKGFSQPVGLFHAGDRSGRLFVLEQAGIIKLIKDGKVQARAFLDIRDIVGSGGERGLLGLAFHPKFEYNGYFFVNYTDKKGNTTIARYKVSNDNNIADNKSQKIIMTIKQPYSNHNGGNIAFGPDGYLYIGTGDGGSGGDPEGNGQSIASLLGKILRIDIDNAEPYSIPDTNPYKYSKAANVKREIWAIGLRNPWRFSFDSKTGDLYIADVGQNKYEEVNFQTKNSTGGENYGWNTMEGLHCYNASSCNQDALVMPILEYEHNKEGGFSITGGYVYHGSVQTLQNKYIFADYVSGNIWQAENKNGWQKTLIAKTNYSISSFGQDENGELYIVNHKGIIYKIK
ncbi:MAG TPA: glucose dehydrogenase [Trueperaceae bacterium]|nr:glucose dehydrogenase [Trueperaceae bacterium]